MKRLVTIGLLILFFAFGFLTNQLVKTQSNLALDQDSPLNRITEDQIHVYSNRIQLDISNASWSRFADTNSMDPLLDSGANGIEIKPASFEEIKIGDIISFTSSYATGLFVHRVIEVGFDDSGWFAITKGDNNLNKDPGKVRFKNISGVVVGIIY